MASESFNGEIGKGFPKISSSAGPYGGRGDHPVAKGESSFFTQDAEIASGSARISTPEGIPVNAKAPPMSVVAKATSAQSGRPPRRASQTQAREHSADTDKATLLWGLFLETHGRPEIQRPESGDAFKFANRPTESSVERDLQYQVFLKAKLAQMREYLRGQYAVAANEPQKEKNGNAMDIRRTVGEQFQHAYRR